MRYELSDYEWTAIKPMLPNRLHGVRRVNDRRVLNGIFWILRSGAPWCHLPEKYGPRATCYGGLIGKIHAVMDRMACRSISLSRRVRRITIGRIRLSSARCFHK
jgi:transposase